MDTYMGKRRRQRGSLAAPWGESRRPRVGLLCLPAILLVAWFAFPVRPGIVLGESMAPSFRDGQVFLMSTGLGAARLARGDVVIVRLGGETYIKRVQGLPGERIRGLVCDEVGGRPAYVASTRAEVRRMQRAARRAPALGRVVEVEIPPESVFVVGDAAGASYDSRHFGPVPMEAIKGRVIVGSLFRLPSNRPGSERRALPRGDSGWGVGGASGTRSGGGESMSAE